MRDVIGLEGQYGVTKDGRIWSYKSNKFISTSKIYSGYVKVGMRDSKDGQKVRSRFVHRIVAQAYVPNPLGKPEVHHKNNVRDCNDSWNLSWVTREENNQAAWDTGNKKYVLTEKVSAAARKNIMKANQSRKERRG